MNRTGYLRSGRRLSKSLEVLKIPPTAFVSVNRALVRRQIEAREALKASGKNVDRPIKPLVKAKQ